MSAADLDVASDVSVLVGEMPAEPCESNNHGHPTRGWNHDEGPATHYLQMMHECTWKAESEIWTACSKSALNVARSQIRGIFCVDCGTPCRPGNWIRVVRPIRGKK